MAFPTWKRSSGFLLKAIVFIVVLAIVVVFIMTRVNPEIARYLTFIDLPFRTR